MLVVQVLLKGQVSAGFSSQVETADKSLYSWQSGAVVQISALLAQPCIYSMKTNLTCMSCPRDIWLVGCDGIICHACCIAWQICTNLPISVAQKLSGFSWESIATLSKQTRTCASCPY